MFCGSEGQHTAATQAARSIAAGIPALAFPMGTDPTGIRWPPVARACLWGHVALTDGEIVALATAMIEAGIDEVFVSGNPARGPLTYRVAL